MQYIAAGLLNLIAIFDHFLESSGENRKKAKNDTVYESQRQK